MVYRDGQEAEAALDAVFGALAHPARRALLRQLVAGSESLAMSSLAASAGLSPQLLTKHLATLERAGLVSRARRGREKHARAHRAPLSAASRWIEETTVYWNAQLDSLEEYVASLREAELPPPRED